MNRLADLVRFYGLLEKLEHAAGGKRTLAGADSRRGLPSRGVYFFFEPDEMRTDSGTGARVVRVGTHGLGAGSRSTLRQRLAQHRGQESGGGNHRGSIFRLLIGEALLGRRDLEPCPSWGVKGDLAKGAAALGMERRDLRIGEQPVELAVSRYIRTMPFLWIEIDDEPGPNSLRGYVERNAIALLSDHDRQSLDPPSFGWLGSASGRPRVRTSGLWNQRHVDEEPVPAFLDQLERMIA